MKNLLKFLKKEKVSDQETKEKDEKEIIKNREMYKKQLLKEIKENKEIVGFSCEEALNYADLLAKENNEDKRKAIECYEKVIRIKPDSAKAYFNCADLLAKGNDEDKKKAIEYYIAGFSYYENGIYLEKGLSYEKTSWNSNFHKESIKVDLYVLEKTSNYANLLAQGNNDNKKKAVALYNNLITKITCQEKKLNEQHIDEIFGRQQNQFKTSTLLEYLQKIKTEIEFNYDLLIKENDKEKAILLAQGNNKDKKKAAEYSGKAIELKPDSAEAYFNRANLLAKGNDEDKKKAIKYYEEAIELKPDSAEAYFNCANLLAKGNDEDEKKAIKYYKKSIEIQPEHKAWCNLFLYSSKNCYRNELLEFSEKRMKIDPDCYLQYFLSGLLYQKDDKRKAIEYYEKVIKLRPDFTAAYYNCARLLLKDKNTENIKKAIKYYEKGIKLQSNKPDVYTMSAYIMLANAFLLECNYEKARFYLDTYKNLNLKEHTANTQTENNYIQIDKLLKEKGF